jgi:hypothetical protein
MTDPWQIVLHRPIAQRIAKIAAEAAFLFTGWRIAPVLAAAPDHRGAP